MQYDGRMGAVSGMEDSAIQRVYREFAVKWAGRKIPSIGHFDLMELSTDEAFEDKWNI